jgi:hypothetical protein
MGRPPIDITGQKFRMLEVIGPAGKRGRNLEQWWLCKCNCGENVVRRSSKLRNGEAKSCGCDRNFGHNRIFDREQAVRKATYDAWRASSLGRGISVDLSADDYWSIIVQPCSYCGRSGVSSAKERRNRHGGFISNLTIPMNGLDRVDSSIGYRTSNVVPCCKHCNFAKNTMSRDEFFEWITIVYNHFVKGKSRE